MSYTTVIQTQGKPMKDWEVSCLCPCSAGLCTVAYACFCPCCAAGDVAQFAGRDYCFTCCVIPFFCPCILPCYLNGDRAALAQRLNVNDSMGGCTTCCLFYLSQTCCNVPFIPSFRCCLLSQELAEIAHYKASGGQGSMLSVTTIAAPQQQYMAPVAYQPVPQQYQQQPQQYQNVQPVFSQQPYQPPPQY